MSHFKDVEYFFFALNIFLRQYDYILALVSVSVCFLCSKYCFGCELFFSVRVLGLIVLDDRASCAQTVQVVHCPWSSPTVITLVRENIPLQRLLLSNFGSGPFFRLATPIVISSSSGSASFD